MATWLQVAIAAAAILVAVTVAIGEFKTDTAVVSTQQSVDHDLLIEIRSDVKEIRRDVNEINGTLRVHEHRISELEEGLDALEEAIP